MYWIWLYFCSQRENAQKQSEGQCHLRLHTAGYTQEGYVERVHLALPSPLPLEATLQLNMCSTFAVSGRQVEFCVSCYLDLLVCTLPACSAMVSVVCQGV